MERFAFFRHIEFHGRVAVELLLHPDALALAWTRVAVGDVVVVENVFQFFGELKGDALVSVAMLCHHEIFVPFAVNHMLHKRLVVSLFVGLFLVVGLLGFGGGGTFLLRFRHHRLVEVVLEKFVGLDKTNQLIGVGGIFSISARLQPTCPTLVVAHRNVEQTLVATALQEFCVVFVAVFRRIVFAVAVVCRCCPHIGALALPRVALDAEVVVGACGEFAASGAALQQSLRKGDRGWNAVLLAMANGDALVFVDIFKKYARKPLRRRGEAH